MEEGIDFVDYSKVENLPKITDVDVAFGGGHRYMIKRSQIPDHKWNKLFGDWFYGVEDNKVLDVDPKENLTEEESQKYYLFTSSVISSFSPKHQHKEAFVAYMLSLWLSDYRILDKQQKV